MQKQIERNANIADEMLSTLSCEDTAQSVGIATDSLIRTLADLKKEGLIDMQAGKIILNENKPRNLPD